MLICGIIKLSENYTERDRCVNEDDNNRLFDIICSSFEKERLFQMTDKNHRVTVTIDNDTYERLKYWSARHECSINEYLKHALERSIAYENKDYDLPELEIQRLNQIIDVITVLSSNIQSLESVTVSGFDSLLGLTRGDNYLLENEDGEI